MKAPVKSVRHRLPVQLELPLSDYKTPLTGGMHWWETGDGHRLKPANSNDPFALIGDREDRC